VDIPGHKQFIKSFLVKNIYFADVPLCVVWFKDLIEGIEEKTGDTINHLMLAKIFRLWYPIIAINVETEITEDDFKYAKSELQPLIEMIGFKKSCFILVDGL